jgi:hypothetical protein
VKWLALALFTLFVSYGINWDSGFQLHPDERFLAMSAEQWSQDYYNTHWFVYGTLTIKAARLLHGYFDVSYTLLLRALSLVSFWSTIASAGILAAQLGGSAYVVAWLCASSVALIQNAHFGTVDMPGVALIVAACCARRHRLLCGTLCGLAAGCKPNFALALIVCPYPSAVCAALVMFRLVQPESFVGLLDINAHWVEWLKLQWQVAQPNVAYPPSVQWFDNPWWNAVLDLRFGMGTLSAIVCALALVSSRWKSFSVSIVAALFLLVAWSCPSHYMRYALPAYPLLFVVAASSELSAIQSLVQFAVALQLCWALSFSWAVYYHENTRVRAAKWVAEYLPPGRIAYESAWDDKLPIRTEGDINLDLFNARSPDVDGSDYIFITSRRVLGSAGRVYSATRRYYEQLFAGISGYRLVKSFSAGLNDESADESFQVYDHPDVWIFMRASRAESNK